MPRHFRFSAAAWIILLWLLLTVPSIFLRGAHYEEGFTIGLARGAFEGGHWLSPHLYGLRDIERPVLISWLLGAVGLFTHRIDFWLARLPEVFSILAGALCLNHFVRRYASAAGGLCAALCFLVSPMILQKIVTAEPDTVISFLLFVALVTWWTGFERGKVSGARALAISVLLSIAALIKGPQPLAYFFIGVGSFLWWKGNRRELLKLAAITVLPIAISAAWYLAVYQPGDLHQWLYHSRMAVLPAGLLQYCWRSIRFCFVVAFDWLPAVLLVFPAAVSLWRKRRDPGNDLPRLLLLYALGCTAILVFWPGANARYSMPGFMAIAALAGLEFDTARKTNPRLTTVTTAIAAVLGLYGIAVNCVVMPLYPDRFRAQAILGQTVNSIVAGNPAPVCVTEAALHRNLLLYLSAPVRVMPFAATTQLTPPCWGMVTPSEESALRTTRRDVTITTRLELFGGTVHLVEIAGSRSP